MASVTTSVRLEQKLAQRLERAAARLSRGKNWIVTKALEEYLAKVNQDDLAAEARAGSRSWWPALRGARSRISSGMRMCRDGSEARGCSAVCGA